MGSGLNGTSGTKYLAFDVVINAFFRSKELTLGKLYLRREEKE